MKSHFKAACALLFAGVLTSCSSNTPQTPGSNEDSTQVSTFNVEGERFADLQMLRYQVPGFNDLTLRQKELAYYLYQAALSGRDIIYDQKYKHNLVVRRTIDGIYETYKGDRESEQFKQFDSYAKRVWFSNGIHHHTSNIKFVPEFTFDYFTELLKNSEAAKLPFESKSIDVFAKSMKSIIFDANYDYKLVNATPGKDLVTNSSNNFYEGVTQAEVESYYSKLINSNDTIPISFGLNSKMVKENGKVVEKVWRVGGMYSPAIERIVYWLEKAVTVAENANQKDALQKLVAYYKTGDLKMFDDYNIAWVKDTSSVLDVVNGFIEVYGDPMGKRGSFESVVSIKDKEATKRIAAIAREAQWFEDNSPIMEEHKKKNVTGISAKVITVIVESGDAAPSTPIGINLPNSNWIRTTHGSKSVSLGNIVHSYNSMSAKSPVTKEFAYNQESIDRMKKYAAIAGDLHTDMHEVIGHASGQINKGIGTPDQTLKNYANTLEEGRADLVALYFIMDQKLVDMGVMPSLEVGKSEYDSYILNGLMLQLNRLNIGEDVEEAHMRNRQLIAKWAYEKGKKDNVIEKVVRDGKTYFKINDYVKLRAIFGGLLREIQRIKSEGDYEAGKNLVETYGVKVDTQLHKEVKERFAKLNVAPYKGFIQPKLVPVMEGDKIVDVRIEYPMSFADQMLEYGREYSYLPNRN
ncbi:MAG: dipeptidyl peptidase 3 [Bacteroidota bacterium]|nr:dipeptidyl peptidase 3 [Bacteroidota bacterium]